MSDAELFLLGWSVVATVMAFKWKAEAVIARDVFMHFVRDEKQREKMLADWEEFKKSKGVA